MPESNRTICALSAPVQVFTNELMAELVQKLPKETCVNILRKTLLQSQNKLLAQKVRNRRSDAYKAMLLARTLASHIKPVPDDLAVLLGEKSADEVPMEGMQIDEDFVSGLDIPEFKQYASVFDTYPYLEVRDTTSYGKLLVLGYCSGRGRQSNKLYRRNCTVVRQSGLKQGFRDLGSAIGVLSNEGPDGTHYTIKAIPFEEGIGVKFWTNLVGEGDIQDQYRYLLLGVVSADGRVRIHKAPNEVKWKELLDAFKRSRETAPAGQVLLDEFNPKL
jgi:hypothetical protein